MQHFKITNRYNPENTLFEGDFETFGDCVEQAVKLKINLNYSNLSDSNLSDSNLSDSDLSDSDLSDSNLSDSNLSDSDLRNSNLRNSDLSDSNLSHSNLRNCIGNMKEVKSGQFEDYQFVYTADRLQIGCENHSIDEWEKFSDHDILQMDGKKALTFWNKWKNVIFQIIEMSPAVATGHESKD